MKPKIIRHGSKTLLPSIPRYNYRGMDEKIPSKGESVGNAEAVRPQVYTGDQMLGIATMHKSNAVPVFSEQSAKDISSMRR